MNSLIYLIGTLLAGPFLVYLAGRSATLCRGARIGSLVAGVAAGLVIMASMLFLLITWRRVAGGETLACSAAIWNTPAAIFLRADNLSAVMCGVILLAGLAAVVYSLGYMAHDTGVDKFYPMLLFMLGAMIGLTVAEDVFTIFVFFELMSVSSFVLVSFRKNDWEPIEAGFKYIILSCVGSFLLLLGIALLFMYTGHLGLDELRAGLARIPAQPRLLMMALIIGGFGVKAAIVPLHTWLPDAHTAAPSGISALLSGVVIQTGFFAMLRVLLEAFPGAWPVTGLAFLALGALTMTVGNLTALQQKDIKRMLAYSSIAQMGYILMGVGIGLRYGVTAGLDGGLFHIMTHAFMKGLAFLSAGALIHAGGSRELDKLHGMGRKMPLTAAAFAVAGLGLAGVPPFSGFMSKLLIYEAGFKTGQAWGYVLACLAILNSVISLGYYLPAMANLFATRVERQPGRIREAPPLMLVPTLALTVLTIALGIWPDLGLRFVYPAVRVIVSTRI